MIETPPAGYPHLLEVLVATKSGEVPTGLQYLPSTTHVCITDTRPGWAKAANAVLDAASTDALFADDDIELTPYTFSLLSTYWDRADVFGFSLMTKDEHGIGLASCGYVLGVNSELVPQLGPEVLLPAYLAHVTASCMIVKRQVLEAGVRFPDWPGMHSEDVAFTLDCWLHGFKVAYLPGVAFHHIGTNGVGATKTHEDAIAKKIAVNKLILGEWMHEHHVGQALSDGVIPFGAVLL